MTMTAPALLITTTYFKINGGETILEKRAEGWFRWDSRAGVVPTSIDWDSTPERLTQLSYEEAAPLITRANTFSPPTNRPFKKSHTNV